MRHLSENRAETAIYILIFSVFLIIELGSFFILLAESGADQANIIHATDAIWWTYVTITTVGYGDRYPVTAAGRIIGILVMTTGVGIFATFAGYIANKLLYSKNKDNIPEQEQDNEIGKTLKALQGAIEKQQVRDSELAVRLKRIEELIERIQGQQ